MEKAVSIAGSSLVKVVQIEVRIRVRVWAQLRLQRDIAGHGGGFLEHWKIGNEERGPTLIKSSAEKERTKAITFVTQAMRDVQLGVLCASECNVLTLSRELQESSRQPISSSFLAAAHETGL